MNARELPNGNLLVPRRAEGPNGEIGDGMVEIGPDDPGFQVWSDWLRSQHPNAAQEASEVVAEMRRAGPLGTLADFEAALDYAIRGAVVSDTGLSGEVLDALDVVARAAPNPPQRLIDAAWDAYRMNGKG